MARGFYNKTRNERNKATRRISRLRDRLSRAVNGDRKNVLQAKINELSNAIEATRTYDTETGKRVRDAQTVRSNVQKLANLNDEYKPLVQPQVRSNRATEIQINMASSPETETASDYTAEQVHLFYRSTMKAWTGTNSKDRNKAIMAYYGYDNLQEAFEDITGNAKNKAIQEAINTLKDPNATDEEKADAQRTIQDNEDDFQISPESTSAVIAPAEAPM